jgi:hypothetical protein
MPKSWSEPIKTKVFKIQLINRIGSSLGRQIGLNKYYLEITYRLVSFGFIPLYTQLLAAFNIFMCVHQHFWVAWNSLNFSSKIPRDVLYLVRFHPVL